QRLLLHPETTRTISIPLSQPMAKAPFLSPRNRTVAGSSPLNRSSCRPTPFARNSGLLSRPVTPRRFPASGRRRTTFPRHQNRRPVHQLCDGESFQPPSSDTLRHRLLHRGGGFP